MASSIPENHISPSTAKVLAVVVTYNPDLESLTALLQALVSQQCSVLLVDNNSTNKQQIKDANFAVDLVFNERNLGLGAAHNQGLLQAKSAGADYLLVMDQDSVPLENMVAELVGAYEKQSQTDKVSAVGSCYLNSSNQSESFFVRFGKFKFQREYANRPIIPADFLISSGTLFSVATLDDIGGMDESLFIDHVDTEWFLRARSKGYKAFGVSNAKMQHGLGEQTHQINLGGRQRNVPQHKPFRYYYIVRNSIDLYKRSYTSWLWKWNDIQRLAMILLMFGFVKSPRWQNLRMMLLGAWHGLIGRTGEFDFSDGQDT